MASKSIDKCFIIVPSFIPLIGSTDYVVDYIKRIKNGKKVREYSKEFERLCQLIATPDIISDYMIFDILYRICNNYEPGKESKNPMWNIFQDDNKEQILQMTALMIRFTSTSLSSKIASSGGLSLSPFINKSGIGMSHLNSLLSQVWQPVVLQFNKTKGNPSAQLQTFKNVSSETFDQIRDGRIEQKRKMNSFNVWKIRPEYQAWALLSLEDSSPLIPAPLQPTSGKIFENNLSAICLHVMEYFELFTEVSENALLISIHTHNQDSLFF